MLLFLLAAALGLALAPKFWGGGGAARANGGSESDALRLTAAPALALGARGSAGGAGAGAGAGAEKKCSTARSTFIPAPNNSSMHLHITNTAQIRWREHSDTEHCSATEDQKNQTRHRPSEWHVSADNFAQFKRRHTQRIVLHSGHPLDGHTTQQHITTQHNTTVGEQR
jgi:hypothetical protein